MNDIEGKAAREAASERGRERVSIRKTRSQMRIGTQGRSIISAGRHGRLYTKKKRTSHSDVAIKERRFATAVFLNGASKAPLLGTDEGFQGTDGPFPRTEAPFRGTEEPFLGTVRAFHRIPRPCRCLNRPFLRTGRPQCTAGRCDHACRSTNHAPALPSPSQAGNFVTWGRSPRPRNRRSPRRPTKLHPHM